MSEEERIWANALSDAIEPANEYARKIKDRYLVTAKNDMYGIDQTMNIISQAYLPEWNTKPRPAWERHDSAMNAQRTSAEETERTLRAESVLSDDRLPKKTKPAHSGGKDRNDRNDQTESKRPSTW